MSNEIRDAFLRLHNKMRDSAWIFGKLGRQNSDGTYTIRVSDKPGWVHVRLGPDGRQGNTIAKNEGVPLHRNLPIKMLRENNILVIHGMDTRGGFTFTGGGIPLANHWWQHDRLGPDPGYIAGLAFLPLAVTPSNPPAMTVTVHQGWYRYAGARNVWQRADSGSLSAYVPAAGLQHFVVVCLNRSDNTLVIVDGTDKVSTTGASPFTPLDVLAIDIEDEYFPLAAVRFYNGQTVIRAPDIFMDLRLWGGELFGEVDSGGGLSGGWTVDYDAIIPSGKDAFIPGTVSILDGASVTADGDLYVV